MDEQELRALKRAKNAEINALYAQGKYSQGRALRKAVLRLQAKIDAHQQARVAEYERIATEGISTEIRGAAAAAVSEAERIVGGKG